MKISLRESFYFSFIFSMWNIFGDTDDITFGTETRSAKPLVSTSPQNTPRVSNTSSQSARVPAKSPSQREHRTPTRSYAKPASSVPTLAPISHAISLSALVTSMKPTYLPNMSSDILRVVLLSEVKNTDPLMLLRAGDATLLIWTGFSEVQNAGKTYPTFPDMRLIQSEKDRLTGWVLLEPGFDSTSFQMILEMLGFPFVYATRDVIAYIRDTIKDGAFLDKCRFFELFSPGVDDRVLADFTLKNTNKGLSISIHGKWFVDTIHSVDDTAIALPWYPLLSRTQSGYEFIGSAVSFSQGEIIDIVGSKIVKNSLKFTFDTFYRDELSIGVVAGYALKDREELASNGVLTFVLEEDVHARAIVGHIFIDSRGFVHAYEMMNVHKQILKWIRHIYEEAIIANPRIERWELVQNLRRELTKYCYLITGRTPVVMPIIIER